MRYSENQFKKARFKNLLFQMKSFRIRTFVNHIRWNFMLPLLYKYSIRFNQQISFSFNTSARKFYTNMRAVKRKLYIAHPILKYKIFIHILRKNIVH